MKKSYQIKKADIVDFFKNHDCQTCPFKDECNNMHDYIRRVTTDVFAICDVILNRL